MGACKKLGIEISENECYGGDVFSLNESLENRDLNCARRDPKLCLKYNKKRYPTDQRKDLFSIKLKGILDARGEIAAKINLYFSIYCLILCIYCFCGSL